MDRLGCKILGLNRWARAENHCTFYHVSQFAHVTRPVVPLQFFHCLLSYVRYGLFYFFGKPGGEKLCEIWDVFFSLP